MVSELFLSDPEEKAQFPGEGVSLRKLSRLLDYLFRKCEPKSPPKSLYNRAGAGKAVVPEEGRS